MTLDAVAGDGILLKARARVTVRTNIHQLIGGATEETIVARVGQGIVQAIGSTKSYKLVLENPEMISQTVLNQGLEAQTAFEIVSIDIADIDVGENIGARLSADQAEAVAWLEDEGDVTQRAHHHAVAVILGHPAGDGVDQRLFQAAAAGVVERKIEVHAGGFDEGGRAVRHGTYTQNAMRPRARVNSAHEAAHSSRELTMAER